jgi:RimJ/RimL family protein N-acetyltransferase
MLTSITLKDERIELKSVTSMAHSERIIQWLNDPEINKYLYARHEWVTVSDQIEHIQSVNSSLTSYYFGIYLNLDSRLVGTATCRVKNEKTLDIGILIGEKDLHRMGLGISTLALLEVFAKSLGLKKLSAGIECENQPSLSLFLKMNFKIEESVLINEYGNKCIQLSKDLDNDKTS